MILELPDEPKKVLQVVMASGSIRGFELKQRCMLPPEKLIEAANLLVDRRFITASGVIGPDTIDRVRFAPLSSSLENRLA